MMMFGIRGLLFFVLVILVVVGIARYGGAGSNQSSGLRALEERYAKGEISRDEYLQKKRDLRS